MGRVTVLLYLGLGFPTATALCPCRPSCPIGWGGGFEGIKTHQLQKAVGLEIQRKGRRVGSGVFLPRPRVGKEDFSCTGLTRAVNVPQSCPLCLCSLAPPCLRPSSSTPVFTDQPCRTCLLHVGARVLSQTLVLLVYFSMRLLMFIK